MLASTCVCIYDSMRGCSYKCILSLLLSYCGQWVGKTTGLECLMQRQHYDGDLPGVLVCVVVASYIQHCRISITSPITFYSKAMTV